MLDKTIPGYLYTGQMRLLLAVAGVALRYSRYVQQNPLRINHKELLRRGIDSEAIDKAMKILDPGAHLFDSIQPFMQRPLEEEPAEEKRKKLRYPDSWTIGPGNKPVKKLLPSMLSDDGESFWDLSSHREKLNLEDATLHLVGYHNYSVTGNNAYANMKAETDSPGIHFARKNVTITEILWEGKSLLHTLLSMLPKSWVEGDGLPAWADRDGMSGGSDHPLWRATWSSNTAACVWRDNHLVGVRVGGLPLDWIPAVAGRFWAISPATPAAKRDQDEKKTAYKKIRSEYRNTRNIVDPFYFYRINKNGKAVAQTFDFGRDATDLAVEWAANGSLAEAARSYDRVMSPQGCRLVFIRHYIQGEPTSPVIRSSRVENANPKLWPFGISDQAQLIVQGHAKYIQKLYYYVMRPFISNEKAPTTTSEGLPLRLSGLVPRYNAASDAFWRSITGTYARFLSQVRAHAESYDDIKHAQREAAKVALDAFDEVIGPYREQNPAVYAALRATVERDIKRISAKLCYSSERQGGEA